MADVCRSTTAVLLGAIIGWHISGSAARAQFFGPDQFELSSSVHLDEADSTVRAQLERIRACVADKQWDEAVETLRKIMENPAGKVIALAEHRYVNLADYCHAQIASLPPPALELYRQRIDPVAQEWYDQGIAERDRSLLARVVSQLFCSSVGDDALLALGEMAAEQGQFGAARAYWEKILEFPPETVPAARFKAAHGREGVPAARVALIDHWYRADHSPDPPVYRLRHEELFSDEDAATLVRFWKDAGLPPTGLSYPGTSLPLADVRARLVLVSILEGSLTRAGGELDAFAQRHPTAEGLLGGRRVNYASALASLLTAAASWPARPQSPDWPTFAGSPARNKVPPEALELDSKAAWPEIELGEPLMADVSNSRKFSSRRVAEDSQGLLSYHPVVAGDLILINNQTQILAYNIHTGKPAWPSGNKQRKPGEFYMDDAVLMHAVRLNRGLGVPRFTMTVHEGKLYARMGSQITSRPLDSPETYTGHLICMDLAAQGRECWKIAPDGDKWSFEGAPVVDGSDVYVAMRKSDVRPQSHVACFDAETGRRKWRTLISAAETPGGGMLDEITHNLLTLEEGTLYCNTNLGAVAAVNARDGQIQWVTLYPRAKRTSYSGQDRRAAHFYRDLNPCIYYRGLVLVAPADCEGIFALDAGSGQMVWESHLAEDAVHLLGVGGGNLLASGDRLWWIDAAGGKVVGWWPDVTPHGYGRGVLADGRVYWPTREYLYVFDQHTTAGRQVSLLRDPIPLVEQRHASGGNLVLADGVLLIAAANKIYGFRNTARQPGGAAAPPRSAKEAGAAPPARAEVRP